MLKENKSLLEKLADCQGSNESLSGLLHYWQSDCDNTTERLEQVNEKHNGLISIISKFDSICDGKDRTRNRSYSRLIDFIDEVNTFLSCFQNGLGDGELPI